MPAQDPVWANYDSWQVNAPYRGYYVYLYRHDSKRVVVATGLTEPEARCLYFAINEALKPVNEVKLLTWTSCPTLTDTCTTS